ncbi:MAG: 5-(carboxyamino)imidazole ribonucleotide synthase [Burkholderiaceae bacterium]|nr:MAG: 5-(carboxyamino)imidazole ribonucleotide synthase [Burkholderiaceae bacterium]
MHVAKDADHTKKPVAGTNRPVNGPRIGIIGGGQLARMIAIAAQPLGNDIVVLERTPHYPASTVATQALVGDWNSLAPLQDLAARVDLVTLENEFVDAGLLAELEQAGHTVLPSARTLGLVQDKLIQKQTLKAAGLPVPDLRDTPDLKALADAAQAFGYPFLLKARRNGYDGKGNVTVRAATELETAWKKLGGDRGNALFAEAWCPFVRELAVIITRGRRGESAVYPVVETVQRDHICHIVRAPATGAPEVLARAGDVANRAVAAVGAVGSFGVELFQLADGSIVVNELAPRVHNSGHYTIEGCVCSQFENHVRAVLGLPLGSPRLIAPAVMVNLIGTAKAAGHPQGLEQALAVPGAHVHLYGKAVSAAGRKMGHVTAVAETLAAAEATAFRAANHIVFGNPA